jgi:phospholipid/cholesterol/gamma-HCH transport system substrate-binding protein
MENKVNFAVVGAFVIGLAIVLVAGVLWLVSGGSWQKKYDLYLAQEDESVAGLNLNAPVKYNGVAVGKVQQIELDAQRPQRVNLTFAIERGTPIREDTFAVLKTQGLTGIAYVELSGGEPDSPLLRATPGNAIPVIRTRPSLSARLENVLTTVLTKLDSTSNNINAILSAENQTSFRNTLADLASVAHTVAGRKADLDSGIASAAKTFKNTARATTDLDALIAQLASSAAAVEEMGKAVTRTSQSTGKMVDAAGAGVQRFTQDTQPELERLLGELGVLANSLRRLSEQIERNPSGLLLGRKTIPAGPGESQKP